MSESSWLQHDDLNGIRQAFDERRKNMRKMLFFDNNAIQSIHNLKRVLNKPVKYSGNPLFEADKPWENRNITTYGTVLKTSDGLFQAWYTVISPDWRLYLAYAESQDGIDWTKPELDICSIDGQRTNIILDANAHGPAILYDALETREEWRYKMLSGADPNRSIFAFHSADGIRWSKVRDYPVITTKADCPMGFLRQPDGRYAAYHRVAGMGRRIFRSESWDFLHWSSEPLLVMEPDAADPPLVQFYGLGSAPYGNYEIGTLWIYNVDPSDPATMSGYQEAELAYARSGYAWHRAMQGNPFIPHGTQESWESGNLQVSSAPVFLDNEIRYYYAATQSLHSKKWEISVQQSGLGMASIKPDQFVGLEAQEKAGMILTMPFFPSLGNVYINATKKRNGRARVAILSDTGEQIPGFTLNDSIAIESDRPETQIRWRDKEFSSLPMDKRVILCIELQDATLYSVSIQEDRGKCCYYQFTPIHSGLFS